ncbi:hypothetical protein M0802_014411, partial [Mischocyttarus mexicanus]
AANTLLADRATSIFIDDYDDDDDDYDDNDDDHDGREEKNYISKSEMATQHLVRCSNDKTNIRDFKFSRKALKNVFVVEKCSATTALPLNAKDDLISMGR